MREVSDQNKTIDHDEVVHQSGRAASTVLRPNSILDMHLSATWQKTTLDVWPEIDAKFEFVDATLGATKNSRHTSGEHRGRAEIFFLR
jgi:hypothetical protein